ncbi:MAG: MFS transporter [Thermoleophilia bacterium]
MDEALVIARLDRLTFWPYRRRVLLSIGAAYLFAFFDVVNIGAAIPTIAKQFGVSTGTVAVAVSIGLVGYIVGALADGWVSDRVGRRPALMISIVFFSVGTLICALAPSIDVLYVGRFLSGVGIGAEIATATAYIAGISPAPLRGRAGSTAVFWGFIGLAVVPFIALALVPRYEDGWRYLFAIGGIGGLLIIPLRRHLPESPRWLITQGRLEEADALVTGLERIAAEQGPLAEPAPVPVPAEGKPPVTPRSYLKTLVVFTLIWFVYYLGNYGWLTLGTTLLTDQGFTLTTSLTFLCVSSIGFVIGPLIAIRAADRYERKVTITLALLVYSAAFIAIALAPTSIVVMAGGLVITFTIGLAVPLMYTLTAESFPNTIRARSIASADGLGHLGGALAPFLILPAAGVRFSLGMSVMAASGLITAALVLMTRRHTGESLD